MKTDDLHPIHPTPDHCGEVRRDWPDRRRSSGPRSRRHDYVADERAHWRREAIFALCCIFAFCLVVIGLMLWAQP